MRAGLAETFSMQCSGKLVDNGHVDERTHRGQEHGWHVHCIMIVAKVRPEPTVVLLTKEPSFA